MEKYLKIICDPKNYWSNLSGYQPMSESYSHGDFFQSAEDFPKEITELSEQYDSEESDSDDSTSFNFDDKEVSSLGLDLAFCYVEEKQQTRPKVTLPLDFDTFIQGVVEPTFESHRRKKQNQFAVLMLTSDEELMNPVDLIKFYPRPSNLPPTSQSSLSMPASEEDYHNYIVARPRNNHVHSEALIFQNLDKLCKGYSSHNNGIPPKCFILYSWNFPCTKCTDLIIKSFNRRQYRAVKVIVAARKRWTKETRAECHQSIQKMEDQQISCYIYDDSV